MKTLLKVVLIAGGVLLLLPLLPVVLGLALAGLMGVLLFGALLLRGAAVVVGCGLAAIGLLAAGLCVLGAVLSPVWIPVAVGVGLILWLKKPARRTA